MARKVVIVGSGVAGALTAQALLARDPSCSVVMLEAGARVSMRDRRIWMDYVTSRRDPYRSYYDLDSDNPSLPQPLGIAGSRVIGRGGTTLHWGAWTPRFKPEDFALQSRAGREIDWPFPYDTLEPFYHRAEWTMNVAGDSADNNPPRRGKAYALPAAPFAAADTPVITALQTSGISYAHLPTARSSRCVTTGTCLYCPVGGKYSADLTLDELERDKRFTLITNAPALRVAMRSREESSGIIYIKDGREVHEDADIVVVAAGTIEIPKLLFASSDPRWPEGIGNAAGHLGRHLKTHHVMRASGIISGDPDVLRQELDFPTLCSRHYDTEREQRDGKFFFVRTDTNPYGDNLATRMASGASASTLDSLGKNKARVSFYGHAEAFSDAGNSVGLGKGTTKLGLPVGDVRFAAPKANDDGNAKNIARMEDVLRKMGASEISVTLDSAVRTAHVGSTARMSKEPRDGVVDQDLRVHGTRNLYLCSNAVLPNISAVNPTLTLAALSLRLGDHLGA